MQQVNLVNDNQFDEVDVGTLTAFARHDIPLLWCRHDNLRLLDLLSREVHIASELANLDTIISQPLLEATHDFGYKSFHWRDVDDLESFSIDSSVRPHVLAHSLKDGEHCNISLSSTCWSADKQVLWRVES